MRLQNYNKKSDIMSKNADKMVKKSDIMSKNADKMVKLSQSVNLCYNLS